MVSLCRVNQQVLKTKVKLMISKKLSTSVPYISSIIHSTYAKSYNVIQDQVYGIIKVPQKWLEDIKHVEFNELLASSIGP